MTNRPPLEGQWMLKNVEFNSYGDLHDFDWVSDPDEAQAITSIVRDEDYSAPLYGFYESKHRLLIDVDFPVKAIPSSTPGHTHLYIDKEVDWEQVENVLQALAAAGIVEQGYADACQDQGFTTLRLPWVKKEGVK